MWRIQTTSTEGKNVTDFFIVCLLLSSPVDSNNFAVSLLLDDDDDDEPVDELEFVIVVVAVDVLEVSSSATSFFMTSVDRRHTLLSIRLLSLDTNILIYEQHVE